MTGLRVGAATLLLCGLAASCGGAPDPATSASAAASDTPRVSEAPATPSGAPGTTRSARSAAPTEDAPPDGTATGDAATEAAPEALSAPGQGATEADPHAPPGARRTVPDAAMLTVADLRRLAGGRGWERREGKGDECAAPEGALAVRTIEYGGTRAGSVTQTVATYPDPGASDAAVLVLRAALEHCGWLGVHDPRLGSAAVAGDDSGRTLTAVSVDGALVVLVGGGDLPRDTGRWTRLVDDALHASCPASPAGCR